MRLYCGILKDTVSAEENIASIDIHIFITNLSFNTLYSNPPQIKLTTGSMLILI